jgi:hypothetical protein
MIKLLDLLKENSDSTYDYGCVMLYFNFPAINKIHDAIDPEHIYEEEGDKTFGLEDEPHTTLLFGLHNEVSLDEVKKALDKFKFSTCKVKNASLFENEKYDVFKFDVEGKNLHETNAELRKYPYTNKYDDYHPHLTIGYIKPGLGKKYTKMLDGFEYELVPQYAIFSHPDGTKDKIDIKIEKNG